MRYSREESYGQQAQNSGNAASPTTIAAPDALSFMKHGTMFFGAPTATPSTTHNSLNCLTPSPNTKWPHYKSKLSVTTSNSGILHAFQTSPSINTLTTNSSLYSAKQLLINIK